MACFRFDLEEKLDIIYEEDGDSIARRFYIPVLRQAVRYDRISGYFSVDSLVVVAAGLAGFIHNKGRMRLVVGAHDIGPDLQRAYFLSKEKAEELLQEIGKRIAEGLERIEDVLSRRRLEALAWMLVNGTLEIRVAIPKRTFLGLGNGIFHQKRLLFFDKDDCQIAAAGSANETRMAYEMNGENLTLHMSWAEGHQEYLSRYAEGFEALWGGRHPDYYVYTLPEAIEKRLKERFYPSRPPERDPLEKPELKPKALDIDACVALAPAALLVKELGGVAGLTHLGLGPVRLYPHQAYAVDFVLSRFPHRMLLADEVGLGKTLEAGAIIKRLIDSGQVQRVLILSPKNVARQWLDELWHHFGLRFWLLETGPKRFIAADGSVEFVEDGNPFDRPGFDFMVASWHYARGSRRREPELLRASRFFDLVVVDEAHGARLKRESGRIRPTRLHELCFELGITSPHMLLLSATPVQLYAVEAHDLLRILGLGGPWVHEEDFKRYYELLMADTVSLYREEWIFALRLASWVARSYLTSREIGQLIDSTFKDRDLASDLREAVERGRYLDRAASEVVRRDPDGLKRLLMALSPVQWFMVRNTRERLMKAGYTFPERDVGEEPVDLDRVHEDLLGKLDDYLRKEYARYEKLLSPENRGVIGFVRSVYHQRFVSSFTAAFLTIRHRREFLQSLLDGDREALLRVAAKLLEEEDWEGDEEDVAEAMEEALEGEGYRLIVRELERVRELENELIDYSPDTLSGNDPKLRKVLEVVDDLVSRGHKVLVFSKYTDTVDAVVRFLGRGSRVLTKPEIGVYTGAGGQVFDSERSDYVMVGKEEVRKALDEGPVRVLVCSEAAREGLNLQAANAVVNVDMPWNPAKVEQRIGRSDRLGQKAAKVLVRNVWYPDTIEAEMYRVLFERKEVYGLVVGPAQEIVSEAMRRALDVGMRGAELKRLVGDTLDRVRAVKEDMIRTSGTLTGKAWEGGRLDDQKVVERVTSFALKAASVLGLDASVEGGKFVLRGEPPRVPEELLRWNEVNLEVGRPNAMTPAHPLVQWLGESVVSVAGGRRPESGKSVYVVKDHRGVGQVACIESEGGAPELMSGERVVGLLDELLAFPEGVS